MTGIVDRISTGVAYVVGLLHKWLGGTDLVAAAQAGLACPMVKHTVPGDMCLVGSGSSAQASWKHSHHQAET